MFKKSGFVGASSALQVLVQRGVYAALILASLVAMIGNKNNPQMFENVRMSVLDTVSPAIETLARPVDVFNNGVAYVGDVFSALEDARQLRLENQELVYVKSEVERLQRENSQLRVLSNYTPDESLKYVTARVIGMQSGAFARFLLVNQGQLHGVKKGQAVLSRDGLLGRVYAVGEKTSQVLLLTDLNSRLPVRIKETEVNAMISGNNTASPELKYVPPRADVKTGYQLVTSGYGGMFPAGLPVGRVQSISVDGNIRVAMYADMDKVDYVRLVGFGVNSMTPETAPEKSTEQ